MTVTLERPGVPDKAPGPAKTPKRRRKQNRWRNRVVPLAALLAAALVMLYPVVATYYNNYKQTEFANRYEAEVGSAEAATLQRAIEAAHEYNSKLRPAALTDPYTQGVTEKSSEYQNYLAQLNDFDAMARLSIPGIGVDLPIYHGTSDDTLMRGVGHFYGTALPVGGQGTHSVLTAHSALANASLFDRLPEMKTGDTFFVRVYGQTLAYKVDKISVVLPDELEGITPVTGEDYLTLVTCTPYSVNTHRLLVRAERVPYDEPPKVGSHPLLAMDWTPASWMYARLIGSALMLLLAAAMVTTWVRQDRRRERMRRERRIAKEAAAAALATAEAAAGTTECACACGGTRHHESTTTSNDASDRNVGDRATDAKAGTDAAAERPAQNTGGDDEPRTA